VRPIRSRSRPWVAIAVAATVTAGVGVTAVAAHAASGCQVAYTVSSQWQGGFGANVTITNLGDPISSWNLAWSFGSGQTITSLWNGSYTQSGANVTVANLSYNGSIATGGNTSFGFNGAWTSSNPVPASFTLNGTTCTGVVSSGSATPTPSPTPSPSSSPSASPSASASSSPSASASSSPSSSPSGSPTPWPPSATFSNPVLWEDFPDNDVFRLGNAYYYSASSFHESPGAPIMRSYDLVHWEVIGHSVPSLDFGSNYSLSGGRAYVKGIWASTLRYRQSNGTFYWLGCIDFNKTYVYTSAGSITGPWKQSSIINNCYYDAGMLIDDNDTMYVAYGSGTHYVAQLSADGLSQVKTQAVFTDPSNIGSTEGNRMYKINGAYYILVTHPANAEYVLKSTSGPFGPYTEQPLEVNVGSPVPGGGVPHQGSLVQTANGDWYYMAFVDSYPGGRIPVLAPVTFNAQGWPVLQTVNGAWGTSYPYPNVPRPPADTKPPTGTDTFAGTTLDPQWEWNHNPDNTKWSVNNGLTLQTATVTGDLYSARNTLTHRILGPSSTATIQLNYGNMHDGDRAGLAMFRNSSAWIGIVRDNGATKVAMTNNLTMDGSWNTTGTGTQQASASVSGGKIWLRISANIAVGSGDQAHFSYSTDGVNFTTLGSGFTLDNSWQFFLGYRFGLFNYATQALGGSVNVSQFTLSTP
jgi:beta-xylosidase